MNNNYLMSIAKNKKTNKQLLLDLNNELDLKIHQKKLLIKENEKRNRLILLDLIKKAKEIEVDNEKINCKSLNKNKSKNLYNELLKQYDIIINRKNTILNCSEDVSKNKNFKMKIESVNNYSAELLKKFQIVSNLSRSLKALEMKYIEYNNLFYNSLIKNKQEENNMKLFFRNKSLLQRKCQKDKKMKKSKSDNKKNKTMDKIMKTSIITLSQINENEIPVLNIKIEKKKLEECKNEKLENSYSNIELDKTLLKLEKNRDICNITFEGISKISKVESSNSDTKEDEILNFDSETDSQDLFEKINFINHLETKEKEIQSNKNLNFKIKKICCEGYIENKIEESFLGFGCYDDYNN